MAASESESHPLAVLAPPFVIGWFLLICCYFSLTFPKSLAAKGVRLVLAPIGIYSFYKFSHGYFWVLDDNIIPREVSNYVGLPGYAFYHICALIETSLININDASPPLWISKETRRPLPLPKTFSGRLKYALDLWGSPRGSSWISGRYWDFAPSSVANYKSSYSSRLTFLLGTCINMILIILPMDVMDSYTKQFQLNTLSSRPITDFFPWYTQMAFSLHLCAFTYATCNLTHAPFALFSVGLGFTPDLDVWQPMFSNPLWSPNLTQFWSQGWHTFYRRTFLRLSAPFTSSRRSHTVPEVRETNPRRRQSLRERFVAIIVAFTVSAILHGLCYGRVPADALHPHTSLIEMGVMMFFVAQPVGIALDTALARFAGDSRAGRILRRVFGWFWLLWTARWWADVFAKKGLWDNKEKVLFISPTRGILWGDWMHRGP
ncbi:uncharacterized protein EI90DRAFT_2964425 [Cantharellus anzutake]|uniref:uncharacterized protein n=1 Tax=Cantharellus anzutake TaxID=1750568 RepID=UPI001907D532|nr:uncharacterized protein EI90DRAFT_2964425 [Cantharellus anzutake]KAF8342659.1 hypothetical protein EI90DRAFT_2964425 [Cantharellus anzutake]